MTTDQKRSNMNLAEVIRQICFYKRNKFSDSETKDYITGKKDLFKGHSHLKETANGFNLWYFNESGKSQMIPISREEFFGMFFDDDFEVDEEKLNYIQKEERKCPAYMS